MKLVFTHANRTVVSNVKNIVDGAGIETLLRNEFAVGAMGEISPFEVWLEVWVVNDADYARAKKLVDETLSLENAVQWRCNHCAELNDPSFDYCWNCRRDNSE